MLSQEKKDKIYNALLVGMALEDAYIYAGMTADEMEEAGNDLFLQAQWKSVQKSYELDLLNKLNQVADKQVKLGKESAITWMLEHMYPRYSGKPKDDVREIHLHIDDVKPETLDTVEVSRGA